MRSQSTAAQAELMSSRLRIKGLRSIAYVNYNSITHIITQKGANNLRCRLRGHLLLLLHCSSIFWFVGCQVLVNNKMQQTDSRSFKLKIDTNQITINLKPNRLRVTLVNYVEQRLLQQIYQQKNLPTASAKTFANCGELYSWLQKYKDYPQYWNIQNSNITVTFEKSNLLNLTLIKLQPPDLFICLSQTEEIKQHIAHIYAQLQSSRQRQQEFKKQLGQKQAANNDCMQQIKRDVAELQQNVQSVRQESRQSRRQLQELIANQTKKIEELDQTTATQISAVEEGLKQTRFEVDVSTKTLQRNLTTLKEELTIFCETNKTDIKQLADYVAKANLEQIKNDYAKIITAFDTQIRIKDYYFKPDARSLQENKKVYFLNNKSLKCMEDTKDYFKVAGSTPYPFGRYHCRFIVKNIKNNGLLLGVCNAKAKNQLEHTLFNDKNHIAINSCGYVINRGAMHSLPWRVKSGDELTMLVSTSTGELRWFCNNIEIAYADLGSLTKEDIFPFVGLGNFCDEVELLQERQDSHVQQTNSTYRTELVKLNQKFGPRRAYDRV